MHRLLLAALLATGVSSASLPALAQDIPPPPPPPSTATTRTTSTPAYSDPGETTLDAPGWSIAALLGFGVNDGVGFGLGARGGYTLDNHVYIGGTLLDHFGSNVNILLFGAEGGYDFVVGPVIIRPYAGLGFAVASISGITATVTTPTGTVTEGSSVSTSSTNIAFWPGGTVIYTIPSNDRFFVGGDARVYVLNGFSTFAIYGFGGMHF